MKRVWWTSLLLAAGLLPAAGCQAVPTPPLTTARSQTPDDPAGRSGGDRAPEGPGVPWSLEAARPESVPAPLPADALAAPPGVSQPLTLDAAVDLALFQNPDLVTLRQDVPVRRAALEVARVYPYNPAVTVEVDPLAEEFGGDQASVKNSVLLTQILELGHQRRYRAGAAAADLTRTDWSVIDSEIRTVAETERRFFTALYQRQLYESNASVADLNDKLVEALGRRFQAGQSTAADVSLARIEARSARQQARLAEMAYQDALRALRTYLGLTKGETLEPVGDLGERRWMPARSVLTSRPDRRQGDRTQGERAQDRASGGAGGRDLDLEAIVADRADVRAASADLRAAQAQWCLARASRVPNVSLGPRYERDESRTLFAGLELQVDVPVINTGRETVWQGETEVRRKQVALEQLRIKARLEIESAVERYERARAIVEQFRPGAAGELDQEVARVADLFLAGQTDLLTLYSIRGKVLQSQRDYLDALNQLAQAAADLTAATATPYTALATLNPQASDR